jgi:FMN phosphatase YigB (HAD superfamily)
MDRLPTLTMHDVRASIDAGEVTLLTSDVFDTLVWRPVAEPRHLFLVLARRCRDAGWLPDWVDDRTFAIGRERAEHLAREAAAEVWGTPECTLEEIWTHMPSAWSPDLDDAVALELAVEQRALRLHPGAVDLVSHARRLGIDVVLVSDTYFSIDQLTTVLGEAGLDLNAIEVVTSSSRRRNKWDGLLRDVVDAHGGPTGAIHIGDNPNADAVVGHRAGVRVGHFDVHRDDDVVPTAVEPWEQLSSAAGSDGGHGAAVRETLVNANDHGRDPSYQFGAKIAGPIMAGFAGWVSSTSEQLGAGSIHCLLREGARIAELIDIVRPQGPPRVLVHASRWAIMRAGVIEGTAEELERALARRADLRAEHVTAAFGCDADRVAAALGSRAIPREALSDAYRALAGDDELRDEIVASSASQRRNVMTYLSNTLRLDDGPLVLADIGWGGTIQEGLTDILRDAGVDHEVIGLYALLSPPGEHRTGRGARMLGYLPTIGAAGTSTVHAETAVRHPEFLERINTPAIGTLLEFDDDGVPVTRADDHDALGHSLRLAQQGVTDFCATLADIALVDDDLRHEWFHDRHLAGAALESLATVIRSPDARLAAALGTWEHDDVAGTAAEALSNDGFRRWVPFANAVDAAEITMHDVFWVPGVASAARSALAEQLDALARGAHPDTLCPPSPTGQARIAVFPPRSELASAQIEVVPRLGTAGWMLLQLSSPVPGLRSIRIDLGDLGLLADVGDVRITIEHDGHELVIVDDVAGLHECSQWVGGRWLGSRSAVAQSGGHLLVDVPADSPAESVSVSIGVRTWPIADDTLSELLPRWRAALGPLARRVRRRLARS